MSHVGFTPSSYLTPGMKFYLSDSDKPHTLPEGTLNQVCIQYSTKGCVHIGGTYPKIAPMYRGVQER